MNKPLQLSTSIISRVPVQRIVHTLQNLHWIKRNIELDPIERVEVIRAIRHANLESLRNIKA